MAIILRLDRVMADRKINLKDLSEQVGIANVNLLKSVYLIATRDLSNLWLQFFYLKIKGLCDFLRKRF